MTYVAYHGTRGGVAESVMRERRIMFPGDTLQDGTILAMVHNNCGAPDKKPVICSESKPNRTEPNHLDFEPSRTKPSILKS